MSQKPAAFSRMGELVARRVRGWGYGARNAATGLGLSAALGAMRMSPAFAAFAAKMVEKFVGLRSEKDQARDVVRRQLYELVRDGKPQPLAAFLAKAGREALDSRQSLLSVCAVRGDVACAELLRKAGFDVKARDREGATILSIAAEANHVEFCRWALRHGAKVDKVARGGADPLSKAASGGAAEAFWLLAGVREPGHPERVALMRAAAQAGKANVLARMLADPKWAAARREADADERAPTLLMLAAFSATGSHDCARLLAASSDVGARRPAWWRQHVDRAEGRPDFLVDAAFCASLRLPAREAMETIELVAALGAPLDGKGPRDRTVLHQAALGARKEQIEWLVGRGLDPNQLDARGDSPLALAVGHVNAEAALALLPLSDPSSRSLNGDSVLMRCAWRPFEDGEDEEDMDLPGMATHAEDTRLDPSRVALAKALVEAGADVEACHGPRGMRAIELAARCGRAGLFRELLPLCDLSDERLAASRLMECVGNATEQGSEIMKRDLAREVERRALEASTPGAESAAPRRL